MEGEMVKTARVVWSPSMDERLLEWIKQTYEEERPDANKVNWREAAKLFEGVMPSQLRKRYKGVLIGQRKGGVTEEEAARLIVCVETMGMVWEDIARLFEGRTGLQLKNYFYTAQRRYQRRKAGLKYGSKTVCPTIDEYFSKTEGKRTRDEPAPVSLTDVVETACYKRRREEANE